MATTTTVMFTDVPGSTGALVSAGDESGRRSLAAHLDLVSGVVDANGGRVVKTLGDGIMALFDSVLDGANAAVAVQQQVQRAAGADQGAPASVRVGLSVGDLPDDEGEVLGATVVLARRLCDVALPGQILAAEVVAILMAAGAGPTMVPAGERELKGLPAAVQVRVVEWEPLPQDDPVRVVVAEDAALIRDGIVRLLDAEGFDVVADVADHDALLAAIEEHLPDLLVTDIRMPPGQSDEGLRAAAFVKAEHPSIAVLVLSQHVEASAAADLLDGQTAGVGYLLKERVADIDEFLDAARRVVDGGSVIDPLIAEELLRVRAGDPLGLLSERERDVLRLMAEGRSNQGISDELFVSAKTVESHVRSIFQKLDLPEDVEGNRRVQAVVRWLDRARSSGPS